MQNKPIKKRFLTLLLFLLSAIPLIQAREITVPDTLRGGISVDSRTLDLALSMRQDGWVYIMPEPKSPQAAWGHTDGRTTWWTGYWNNEQTGQTSKSTPTLHNNHYTGDNQGARTWRRGGTPSHHPNKLEWLLSRHGGIKPR